MKENTGRHLGTHPRDIAYMREEVTLQVERSVAKHVRPYTDLIGGQADRDELVAAVMEKYFKAFGRENRPDRLGAWVKTVVRSTITDELRRRGAQPRLDGDTIALDDSDARLNRALREMATPSLSGHPKLIHLQVALDRLRSDYPNDPELIRLRFEDGLTVDEIAERLRLSSETVKKRLQRAVKRVRRAVEVLERDPAS